jgi:nicotinamide mononucleotide transporter
MNGLLNDIYESLKDTSTPEVIAVVFGLTYLFLIMFKIRIGWLFAAVSTGIYIILSYMNSLYIESLLQVFYFIMAFIGFMMWKTNKNESLVIVSWQLTKHLKVISFGGILCFLLGYIFQKLTSQSDPYLDAFTTVFSLIATFLTAKRVLSNWLYWVVIDMALVALYFSNGLVLTSYHYGFYVALALIGYFKWLKYYKHQQKHA